MDMSKNQNKESNNLIFWDLLREPPVWAKNTISEGKLAGFTEINPQWRMEAMTEVFGPCGYGWKYDIVKYWTHEVSREIRMETNGKVYHKQVVDVMAFMQINIHVNISNLDGSEKFWSDHIPGFGGAKLIDHSYGSPGDDDAYKKALTDALGSAMRSLGVGANVYSGEGFSKYKTKQSERVKYENLPEFIKMLFETVADTDDIDSRVKICNVMDWNHDKLIAYLENKLEEKNKKRSEKEKQKEEDENIKKEEERDNKLYDALPKVVHNKFDLYDTSNNRKVRIEYCKYFLWDAKKIESELIKYITKRSAGKEKSNESGNEKNG